MSIIILGAAGNLGGQLKRVFHDQDVLAWDRTDFDFLDFVTLKKRLQDAQPSLIINAAAYNAVDRCETEEKEQSLAWLLNRDLPGILADYCLEFGIILIHYSTDYVFGGDGRLSTAYREIDRPQPLNIYGQTKFGGEQEIARRALLGLNYYLIITSKIFCPRGENPQAKPSFFEIMLDLAAKNSEVKAVDGEMSCFTYTPDLAEATARLWTEKSRRGVYHLVNANAATWYQGAKYLFELAGVNTPLRPITPDEWPRPAKRPVFSVLANTRGPLMRSWQEALSAYWRSLPS